MNGKTPFEKLKEFKLSISKHVVQFPVVLLEHFLHSSSKVFFSLNMGQYVLDTSPFEKKINVSF